MQMESDKFNRETIDKYLEIVVKKYPKVDFHLLEYIVAVVYKCGLAMLKTFMRLVRLQIISTS